MTDGGREPKLATVSGGQSLGSTPKATADGVWRRTRAKARLREPKPAMEGEGGCGKRVLGYFGPELNFVPPLKSERNSKLRPDNQGGTK